MAESQYCHYFVRRKKRYCRMTVKEGYQFCGEHRSEENKFISDDARDDKLDDKRVLCPLDPTHSCYQSKLAKHLKVCNVKRISDAQPVYVVKGINLDGVTTEFPKRIPLPQLNSYVLETVLQKINTAYEQLPAFSEEILSHAVLTNELNNPTYGKNVRKHLLQNMSLIAHLEKAGLVRDNTCFIEFGAGRGKLTYWLAQMIKEQKDSAILLVDRSSHRHKSDNKLRNEQKSLGVMRVRADIADFQLSAVTEVQPFHHKVGIAKHLCGAATDLMLRCLVKAMHDEPATKVSGLVIAFCCHHRCIYNSYVGKVYLENCGFTPNEFPVLCSIASWATCGSGKGKRDEIKSGQNGNEDIDTGMDTTTLEKRENMGRKVKTLLNWGRLEFLKSAGFKGHLLYYTSIDVSLENMCIVATHNCT